MLTVAWENTMRYFPEYYIMRLLWLHPKALPDPVVSNKVDVFVAGKLATLIRVDD